MEFQDSSLIRIMCNDSVLKERGITENMLEECVIRAMKFLESKNTDRYKIQNAIINEEKTKKAALIAEIEAKELIKNSLNIKKRL
tara:strand:+ start:1744 stop:1998 length:255 start_codon:yes stop_codon:yes gene_type:complete